MTRRTLTVAFATCVAACQVFLDVGESTNAGAVPPSNDAAAAEASSGDAGGPSTDAGMDAAKLPDAASLRGVRAWFRFDGTLDDDSPAKLKHVDQPSGYTFTNQAFAGQALQGSTVFTGIDYGDALDVGGGSFSLIASVRHDPVGSSTEHYSSLVVKGKDPTSTDVVDAGYGLALTFINGTTGIRAAFGDGTSAAHVDVRCAGIANGLNHLVILTFDRGINPATAYVQLWIDGSLEYSAFINDGDTARPFGPLSPSPTAEAGHKTFTIGGYRPNPIHMLWGSIDEVVFLDHKAQDDEVDIILGVFGQARTQTSICQ